MMQTAIVPTISSDTAGPLGAIHLPRFWLKQTLDCAGRLADGYHACGDGFDALTLKDLNLDRDETIAFIREKHPTYMQFEQWVLDKNGGTISQGAIDRHNAAIRGYNHGDEKAASMRSASGVANPDVVDAVTLNTIEDLDEVHRAVTRA
jgi:hypothetical protein